jgi:acyl-CoA dehydrogenase
VCTSDQKERFLKPFLADDTYLLGYAATEPNASSDNRMPPENDPRAGWKLRAERHGDEWILNGGKCYIANGNVGKLFFVSTRTNPDVNIREGTTLFIVPRDTPGLRVGKVFNKSGWRFYQNAELIFDDARVPNANIIGEVNGGFRARGGDASQFGDFELAANALGICDAAVEMAVAHARTHRQDGKRLVDYQTVQLKLSEMHVITEALRAFVMRTAWERERASRGEKDASFVNAQFVMIFSKDVVQRVTHLNMEIYAAAGDMMDLAVDKLVRDASVWTHLAGSTILRIMSVKALTA